MADTYKELKSDGHDGCLGMLLFFPVLFGVTGFLAEASHKKEEMSDWEVMLALVASFLLAFAISAAISRLVHDRWERIKRQKRIEYKLDLLLERHGINLEAEDDSDNN